jgi:hypothetical protein
LWGKAAQHKPAIADEAEVNKQQQGAAAELEAAVAGRGSRATSA